MMSKDHSSLTVCVIDHGFFLPIARKLAESFGRVLYYRPWEKSYPSLNDCIIGDGFGDIECCADFWPLKHEIDLFVFPDIYHMGLQAELRSQGFPVWGAGGGMKLEINRQFFMEKLKELGLDVAPHAVVVGISALRDYLAERENIFIKVSKYRGTWETKHWRDFKTDGHHLDCWAVKFGGAKELLPFLCFDEIDTQLEIGGDAYCVDGQWPDVMLHGIEKKNEAYFSAVTPRQEMPEALLPILEAFSPFLKEAQYRSAWSMEVRVSDKGNFFIDATTRAGLPSTASQLALWENYAEIIWRGAHGELVQPVPAAQFSAECMVKINGEPGSWETIVLPDELKPHLLLFDCCLINDQPWFPSDEGPIEEIGWLVATGNTPTEVAKRMNELADMLPDGADAAVESLADIIREVEEAQKQGIEFTDKPMPSADVVLEPST